MSIGKMKKNDRKDALSSDSGITLRELAENVIKSRSVKPADEYKTLSPDEIAAILHELEVRYVELEIQNRELIRIQSELEKSRAWYLDLYDLAPVGYFTISDRGYILEANLTAASMLGLRRNSLCNKLFTSFVLNEDRDIFNSHFKKLFDEGTKQQFEVRGVKDDGTFFWAGIEVTLAYGAGGALVCRGVISDITGIRKLEEERKIYEEHMQRNRRLEALGILAGGIAHSFNNLLAGIFGYIEIAELKCDKPDVSRYLSEAIGMSERARSLTGQLLAFSGSGKRTGKSGDIAPLIKDSVNFALSGSDITCRFEIDGDLKQSTADTTTICHVIVDVILNARQAMPERGVIQLSACNLELKDNEINGLAEGKYIKISVCGSGSGISREQMSDIFDPLIKSLDGDYKTGLATSCTIIKSNGGAMSVDPAGECGRIVNIYLPASTLAESKHETVFNAGHRGSGTVIIMDDEECVRDSISEMLMSMGYDVLHMEDGGEVISYLEQRRGSDEKIAAIILDLVIPGGTGGKSAVSKIRKIAPEVPAFAISGYADDPVMKNPAEYSFTASISKPFLMSELAEMLNRYM